MRVVSWGPSNMVPPCIPDYVSTFDRQLRGRSGDWLRDAFLTACAQVEVADGSWVGVRHDGVVECFKLSEEKEWRARTATKALQFYQTDPSTGPERAITGLKACASLMGFDLPDLMEALESARRTPGEDLTEVFKRIRKDIIP